MVVFADDGTELVFPVCCTAIVDVETKERFLAKSCWNRQWESVFVESLDEIYTEANEPGTAISNDGSPFLNKSETECWEMLQQARKNGSHVTCNVFVIMDQRSMKDDTVLLVQRDDEEDTILSVRAEFNVALLHLSAYSIFEGSVLEDRSEVESKATDYVLRDWGLDERRRREEVQPRGDGTPVDDSSNPQLQSGLFRLPTALRLRIFEYVIGSGVIHITTRYCKPTARPSPCFGFYDRYSYVICPFGNEHWKKSYETSKEPAVGPGGDPRTNYRVLHIDCAKPLYDFATQQYTEDAEGCRLAPGSRRGDPQAHFDECKDCQNHRAALVSKFGPAPGGLKARHAESGLDLDILLICRQAYNEARHLPFANYTFDFELSRLEHWASKIMYRHQREAIQSAHFNESAGGSTYLHSPGGIQKILDLLPGLKKLRLSLPFLHEDGWKMLSIPRKVETAELILTEPGDRASRRVKAERIERLLTLSESC